EESVRTDLSDRGYFQRVMDTGRPAISNGVLTRLQALPAVSIGVPVALSDGNSGVLVSSVSLQSLAAALAVGPNEAQIGIVDGAGQTIVHPNLDRVATLANIAARPEIAAARAGESGVLLVDRDDAQYVVAYVPMEDAAPW